MSFCIECRESKKGNPYYCLTYGKWVVTFDEKVIEYIASQNGYSKRDIYLLSVGEYIEIS